MHQYRLVTPPTKTESNVFSLFCCHFVPVRAYFFSLAASVPQVWIIDKARKINKIMCNTFSDFFLSKHINAPKTQMYKSEIGHRAKKMHANKKAKK